MTRLSALVGAIALCATLFGPAAVLAQTSAPVEIEGDSFTISDSEQTAVFEGNVVVEQADLMVWADRVEVNYGEGGTSDIKDFEAIGNVRIKNPQQEATGQRGVYNPETRMLTLSGNVEVVNASGTVTADELVVDLTTNVSRFSTSGDSRVRGVFSPDQGGS